MKKILTVIGARPQFIKAATISRVIAQYHSDKIKELILHTGQHYDQNMSDIFFDEMNIPKPDFHLNIGGSTHGEMTGSMLTELEKIMLQEKPNLVLIYGDTNSTLAAALSAAKLHIPVAHVEAGMRSHNKKMPEEINRVLSDHVSTLLFCPTEVSANNLKKESIEDNIYIVGDVMYDAVLFYNKNSKPSPIVSDIEPGFYLATCHRQENTDSKENLVQIFKALTELSKKKNVVLPLHPRTKKYIEKYGIDTSGLTLIPPVGYFDILNLLKKASMVLTDSGGLQKEAYYFKKPVIILREETEWTELVDNQVGILSGANYEKIISSELELSNLTSFPKNLYGDGNSAKLIMEHIKSYI